MNGGAVVLAAHGSDGDDRVNAGVCAVANQVAATGSFEKTVASFYRGCPHYSTVLDELVVGHTSYDQCRPIEGAMPKPNEVECRHVFVTPIRHGGVSLGHGTRHSMHVGALNCPCVIVVPYMTSGGYYCSDVLPRELARNQCFANLRVRVTAPIGTHPGMARIAADRATALAAEHDVALEKTSILIVGHGTKRHPQSRVATITLAKTLAQRLNVIESLPCFLDDQPGIAATHAAARGQNLIAIVFLLTDGPHARRDVPIALSLTPSRCDEPPFVGRVEGKFVVCDAAIGVDSRMARLVLDVATETSYEEMLA